MDLKLIHRELFAEIPARLAALPEAALVEDEQARSEIVKRAVQRVRGYVAIRIGVAMALFLVAVAPALDLLERYLAWPRLLRYLIAGIPMLLVPAIVSVLVRRRLRRNLRDELNRAGFAVCRACGYSLRGLTEARCPECGRGFG